jgi:hypothetical protein
MNKEHGRAPVGDSTRFELIDHKRLMMKPRARLRTVPRDLKPVTSSILILHPSDLAARISVASVTDVFFGSSRRSTAAREGRCNFTGEGVWGWPPDRENAKKVLQRAVGLSGNHCNSGLMPQHTAKASQNRQQTATTPSSARIPVIFSAAIRPDSNTVTMKELNERQRFASRSGAASTSPECLAA